MADGSSGAGDAASLVLQLISGLVDMISGAQTSILTRTNTTVNDISDQVSSLGDNLASAIRTISDQVEESRVNLSHQITNAINDINHHSDDNTSIITSQLTSQHREVMSQLANINAVLSNLGQEIGDAIAKSIGSIVQAITDTETALVAQVKISLEQLDKDVSDAINHQGEVFERAIDHASESIDKLTQASIEASNMLKEELEQLNTTLSSSLSKHADILDKAIRESAFGISTAVTGVAVAEGLGAAEVAAAILAGCSEIAGAIAASQIANKVMLATKIAKDVEVADNLISLLTALGALAALDSPEAIADILTPVVEAY